MTIEKNIQKILQYIDKDPSRIDLSKTPERAAEALRFLTSGYHADIKEVFKNALFESHDDGMVFIHNIEFYSLCEHHLLPFFGRCDIAYLPQKNILGLSKFGEIVDIFARRLQIQERLTAEIAQCIFEELQPRGVGIILQAQHLCMKMRGIQKQNPLMTTQKMLGAMHEPQYQMLFLNHIKGH